MSNSLYNLAKSFHEKEMSTYWVPSTTKHQAAGLSPGRVADHKAAARSMGWGRNILWEPAVICITSTSATSLMCNLE